MSNPRDKVKNPFSSGLISAALLFAIPDFAGQVYPFWMDSSLCFKYIGCNAGFFGYDALLHCISGGAGVLFFLWLNERKPGLQLLPKRQSVRIFLLLSAIALLSVCWEISEYSWDLFRTLSGFHVDLLHFYQPGQPSNADTMGDLTANLAGASATLVFIRVRALMSQKKLQKTTPELAPTEVPAYAMNES